MTQELYRSSSLAQRYQTGDTWNVERQYNSTVERIKRLKPGARRLLFLLHRLLESKSYRPVNRLQIASALQHTKLHHHDLKLLAGLLDARLLDVKRVGLSKLEDMPRGFEYRYSMDIDTAWLISLIRSKEKPVFHSSPLKQPNNSSNEKQPRPAQPDKRTEMQKYLEQSSPWYSRLFDRVLDLFNL